MRILSRGDVRILLPMDECIEVIDNAMRTISSGAALIPSRSVMRIPVAHKAMLGYMPSYLKQSECFGAKLITVFPSNKQNSHQSHSGVIVLFESKNGQPQAIIHAGEITAIRTAAASAVATRILAREDASQLTILGNGEQGHQHLIAMSAVRCITHVRVWGRSFSSAKQFATQFSKRYGINIEAIEDIEIAVKSADIICTTTSSCKPILKGNWLAPGTHLNAVGASLAKQAEVDVETVKRSHFYVDYRPFAQEQAGEYLNALAAGAINEEHIIGEIGEVLLGKVKGRTSLDEITLYKSLGVATQDLAASLYVYEKAIAQNTGQQVDF